MATITIGLTETRWHEIAMMTMITLWRHHNDDIMVIMSLWCIDHIITCKHELRVMSVGEGSCQVITVIIVMSSSWCHHSDIITMRSSLWCLYNVVIIVIIVNRHYDVIIMTSPVTFLHGSCLKESTDDARFEKLNYCLQHSIFQ